MIEVFKTNIAEPRRAKEIVELLLEHFPGNKINFDLHDCDKILRIEGEDFCVEKIVKVVQRNGFICDILD